MRRGLCEDEGGEDRVFYVILAVAARDGRRGMGKGERGVRAARIIGDGDGN